MTGKTAFVGDGDSITVFKAAGVATFPAENEGKAREVLRKIAGEYRIIFLTEELARPLTEFLKRFDEEPYPVVLSICGTAAREGDKPSDRSVCAKREAGEDLSRTLLVCGRGMRET